MQTTDESAGIENGSKMRSTPAIVPLLLAGLFMVTGICVLLIIGKEKTRIIGQTITELDIQPLLNTESPLTDEAMRGKVVVLHFWGYWCPACVKELPAFVGIQKSYVSDDEVIFASVSCSQRKEETLDALKFYTNKFMQHADGKDLPAYYDPVEFSRTRLSQLLTAGGFSYPTTLVIDGAGEVVDVWRTEIPENALVKAINKAKLANKKLASK
jgi:thiol-disulfide isomerase/thioredoxin